MLLMPCIYGFYEAVHVDETKKNRDGVALALSLNNVYKQQTALSKIWTSAWEKILTSNEKKGTAGFIEQMVLSAQASAGASGNLTETEET